MANPEVSQANSSAPKKGGGGCRARRPLGRDRRPERPEGTCPPEAAQERRSHTVRDGGPRGRICGAVKKEKEPEPCAPKRGGGDLLKSSICGDFTEKRGGACSSLGKKKKGVLWGQGPTSDAGAREVYSMRTRKRKKGKKPHPFNRRKEKNRHDPRGIKRRAVPQTWGSFLSPWGEHHQKGGSRLTRFQEKKKGLAKVPIEEKRERSWKVGQGNAYRNDKRGKTSKPGEGKNTAQEPERNSLHWETKIS